MAITYGDVAKLGDRPGAPGALTKLNDLAGGVQISVADRFRIMRFVQLISGELDVYGRLLGQIGAKYGEMNKAPAGFVSFSVSPERVGEYEVEKAKLDDMECESLVTLKPLPVSAYEKVELTPRDLATLEKFIVLPEDLA